MARKIIFIVFTLFLLTSCKSRWMIGTWEGLGQEDQGTVWSVNITAENKNDIAISYPGEEIGSEWELVFEKNDQICYLEHLKFGLEQESEIYTVLVNRISDDILQIKYFEFHPNDLNIYNLFSPEKLIATAMIKRRMGGGNMCKTSGTPKNFEFVPQPIKLEKAAKYKP
ncbi:MAG: hypothetical protein KDC84_07495 [Crocinitomicaceae bacterium]|nr:hypothetical protein [Crocinitomicaceae bacterium]